MQLFDFRLTHRRRLVVVVYRGIAQAYEIKIGYMFFFLFVGGMLGLTIHQTNDRLPSRQRISL